MKIPRKTNYKTVKRQRIRAAVNLHHWRKSFVGLHKTLGIFVKGIDIETGKYYWKDLTTVGYGCINPGVVVDMSNSKTYFLQNDAKLAFHESGTLLTGKFELYGLKFMKEDCDESFG